MISDDDADRAGVMAARAEQCHEDAAVLKRFDAHVRILINDRNGDPDAPVSPTTAKYFNAQACVAQHALKIQAGGTCLSSPYLDMACDKFLPEFRRMRISHSDWRQAEGFE